jgi:hypothetical protein
VGWHSSWCGGGRAGDQLGCVAMQLWGCMHAAPHESEHLKQAACFLSTSGPSASVNTSALHGTV